MDGATQSSMTKEPNICHEKWSESIINSEGADGESQSQTEKPPRIRRVPQMLRDTKDFEKYYEPRFVSIGPCHYGKPELQQGENLKPLIANKFVSNDRQQLEDLYKKLLKNIKEVRECYDEKLKSELDDQKLAEMMLLDGCFVLYYIKCVAEEKIYISQLKMKSHVITFVRQDLFLLENQLPFFVLEVLMKNSRKTLTEDQWMQKINVFIQKNIMAPQNTELKEVQTLPPAHLLELLHRRMVPPRCYIYTQSKSVRFAFRSLKELTTVGIQLEPIETDHVTEIGYDRSILKIPCITVDESTRSKLLNLMAYEMCPDTPGELEFTTYVFFMNSFIDNADDVKELRSAKILQQNCLHSDDDVAQLFNDIGANLGSIPFTYNYETFTKKIQYDYEEKKKRYDNDKMRRYMEDFLAQYFKNPWTVFALIGAVLALLFTGIQTCFQVWSPPTDCDGLCKHIKMTHHI
uniref:Uncharacterized protein n=1 Tax=Davidia involucrata TaxID=16924 RepID=A0A5B7B9X5_DAVIN